MNIQITGKHFDVTDAIRSHTEEKASRLPRYYSSIHEIEIVYGTSDNGIFAEVIVRCGRGHVFVATEKGEAKKDLYACIDSVFHKMERQLTKAKGKERNPKHAAKSDALAG